MGSFSSKPKPAPVAKKVEVTAVDRAVLDLKNSRDRLQRYRKKLEQDDIKLVQQAQKAKASGQTQTALGILRLRKFKKQQAESCEEQLLNVLKMVETIDSKRNDAVLLQAMAAGKDALKQLHEETTVDDIITLLEQISDENAVEQEISDILSNNVPMLSDTDEAQIEAELAAMMGTTTANPTTEPAIVLPDVPSDPLLPEAPTKTPLDPTPATAKLSEEGTNQESSGRVAIPS